jgi:CheY-like chemotaxis protein
MSAVVVKPNHPPRILVVDNEEITRFDMLKNLKHWGYAAFLAEGEGPELMEDAEHKARYHRCHLALVDLHLMDDYDPRDLSGINLINRLEPTSTIIVSNSTDFRMTTNSIKRGALDYVGKSEGPARLREALDSNIVDLSYGCSKQQINWPAGLSSARVSELLNAEAPVDEANDVLIRLFKDYHTVKIEPLGRNPKVALSAKIRPHSFVFQVRADEDEPVIVKLARAARVKREVENYNAHVRNKLPGSFCPALQHHCELWDIGGACYTLLGANGIRTFSSIYAGSPVEDLLKPLQLFFGEMWTHRYASTREDQEHSLFEAYRRLWSKDWYEGLPVWADVRPGLPEPSAWLRQRIGLDGGPDASHLPQQYTAVCHGDLHGDNLLVDHNGSPWVIDFERTGPGPLLVDFVEFEADILNRLSGFEDGDQAEFETLCQIVARPASLSDPLEVDSRASDRARKALAVAQCLRQFAVKVSGSNDPRPYLWGLLFTTLFRARLLQKQGGQPGQLDRTLYLASRLCRRLDNEIGSA